jgi:hypothetical protein
VIDDKGKVEGKVVVVVVGGRSVMTAEAMEPWTTKRVDGLVESGPMTKAPVGKEAVVEIGGALVIIVATLEACKEVTILMKTATTTAVVAVMANGGTMGVTPRIRILAATMTGATTEKTQTRGCEPEETKEEVAGDGCLRAEVAMISPRR